jgi:hypothetical protein
MTNKRVELSLWELQRLLELLEETSQQAQDKDLWLKLRKAAEDLQEMYDATRE